jgi:UDP-glucose 4-epimerase
MTDRKVLVTGSSGHLGEALVRTLQGLNYDVVGIDILPSQHTRKVGSIVDREFVRESINGCDAVLHCATLHKPHVATHNNQEFVDTNVTGTLNLLEEAAAAKVRSFVFTSTTSVYALAVAGSQDSSVPWITEEVNPIPKNIYGVTKIAAEGLCELFHRRRGLSCIILRTSRFFSEEDDRKEIREAYDDTNVKVNEFLYRRVDIEDVVSAHLLAMEEAPNIGLAKYIISATTPFDCGDLTDLRDNAPAVVRQRFPDYEPIYAQRGWKVFPGIDRVYCNTRARNELGWSPRHDFKAILGRLESNDYPFSELTRVIGSKGYHSLKFSDGPFPVEL